MLDTMQLDTLQLRGIHKRKCSRVNAAIEYNRDAFYNATLSATMTMRCDNELAMQLMPHLASPFFRYGVEKWQTADWVLSFIFAR
jgi:hypothetical protein